MNDFIIESHLKKKCKLKNIYTDTDARFVYKRPIIDYRIKNKLQRPNKVRSWMDCWYNILNGFLNKIYVTTYVLYNSSKRIFSVLNSNIFDAES